MQSSVPENIDNSTGLGQIFSKHGLIVFPCCGFQAQTRSGPVYDAHAQMTGKEVRRLRDFKETLCIQFLVKASAAR